MRIKKMSFASAKELSKAEMKQIMAGSGKTCNCNSKEQCQTNQNCYNDCGGKPGDTFQGICE